MALVQCFAVIGVQAEADLIAATTRDFAEPVRIGESLPGESDDVSLPARENGFRLLETVNSAGCNHRSRETFFAHSGANLRGRIEIPSKRAVGIGIVRRHALVAAAARVGVGGFAYFGLFGIVEFTAARQRQVVHACACELTAEEGRIVRVGAARDALIRQESTACDEVMTDFGTYS